MICMLTFCLDLIDGEIEFWKAPKYVHIKDYGYLSCKQFENKRKQWTIDITRELNGIIFMIDMKDCKFLMR